MRLAVQPQMLAQHAFKTEAGALGHRHAAAVGQCRVDYQPLQLQRAEGLLA